MKDRLEIFWSRYTVMLYHLAESLGEVVAFGNMIAVKNDAKCLVSKAEFIYSDI